MKIIVGLGNPGVHYQWSRHNVGFRVVDRLSQRQRIPICSRRFKALYGTGWISSENVVLVKPITFMNLSGEAVRKTANAFSVGKEGLIVIHDDLDLALGRLRVRRKGGDGGHQGVRSIIEAMGSNTFLRLKVGIGRPPKGVEPADYVLSAFEEDDQPQIDSALSRAAEAVVAILSEGVDAAMNRFQKKPSTLPVEK
ncbi:MAG: aminoacyl-tRNA hydrolase [Deltaproteobacteria bacterium RBG_13_52_11b]|nr:MAG: aminoacyl-tRNA hydrolase [Deltaproteobacteria bacterium RBG_13_52_11b]